MIIVDLTHTIHSEISIFPGTEKPRFEQATTFEEHGFVEKKLLCILILEHISMYHITS